MKGICTYCGDERVVSMITWGCVHEHIETYLYCAEHSAHTQARAADGLLYCEPCTNGMNGHLCPSPPVRVIDFAA